MFAVVKLPIGPHFLHSQTKMSTENTGGDGGDAFSLEQLERERVEKLVHARVHFCNQERGGREINLGEMDLKHIPDSVSKLAALRTEKQQLPI